MNLNNESTICAPASGSGGAISVIRMSGIDCFNICEYFFFPKDKNIILSEQKGYTVIFGEIRSGSEIIDEVLLTVYMAPHSYTGENSVEISCHASQYIVTRILELMISNGAVAATPGEFTQRAFLNGKIDLSQAEAVADLIASKTQSSHRIAVSQLKGGFSKEIGKLRDELLNFASLIELELDFGEEDVEFADRSELKNAVSRVRMFSQRLSNSFLVGNAIRNGIPVAIVGRPNTGKSTLLNALLMEERAIVSDIPGTTRDAIEDTIIINGVEFRFIDTAGIRETSDIIENLGIQKTHEKMKIASVVILVEEITNDTVSIKEQTELVKKVLIDSQATLITLINKCDQSSDAEKDRIRKSIDLSGYETLLFVSALNKTGLDNLKSVLSNIVENSPGSHDEVIVTNIRHYEALRNVSESLARVESSMNDGLPDDIVAIDIRQAIHYLGEITGQITTDEILGNIFKNFCIGK